MQLFEQKRWTRRKCKNAKRRQPAKTQAKRRRFPATNKTKRVIFAQAPKQQAIEWPGVNLAAADQPVLYHFSMQPSHHELEIEKWKISPLWELKRFSARRFVDESLWMSSRWLWAWMRMWNLWMVYYARLLSMSLNYETWKWVYCVYVDGFGIYYLCESTFVELNETFKDVLKLWKVIEARSLKRCCYWEVDWILTYLKEALQDVDCSGLEKKPLFEFGAKRSKRSVSIWRSKVAYSDGVNPLILNQKNI